MGAPPFLALSEGVQPPPRIDSQPRRRKIIPRDVLVSNRDLH